MNSTPQPCTPQAVMTMIEYHNQPTAFGWFRKVDCPNFHLQLLPLNEVDFAMMMSDFFITFGVCSTHYDEARYFPAQRPMITSLASWVGMRTSLPYRPLTVAMLCEAAREGRWPEETY